MTPQTQIKIGATLMYLGGFGMGMFNDVVCIIISSMVVFYGAIIIGDELDKLKII